MRRTGRCTRLGGTHCEQIGPGPRHPRPDRAHRTAKHRGGIGIGQADQLGQDESRPSIGIESGEQVLDLHVPVLPAGVLFDRARRVRCGAVLCMESVDPAAADPAARGVGTGAPGDGQEPVQGWPLGPVAVQPGDGALIAFLGEVLGRLGVTEVAAQMPDSGLSLTDEGLERFLVTITGREREAGQTIHTPSIPRGTSGHNETTESHMDRSPHHPQDCSHQREILSASLDGEVTLGEEQQLRAHLAACEDCAAVAEGYARLTRQARLRTAVPVPDLAGRVLDRARPPRLGRGGWMRPALAWVAVVIAVQGVGPLASASIEGVDTHSARHLGAFALALGVGLGYAAWRPHRAFGLLPFALALLATTLAATVLDLWSGRSTPIAESVHLVELVGLVLLWMISGSPGWERIRYRAAPVPTN